MHRVRLLAAALVAALTAAACSSASDGTLVPDTPTEAPEVVATSTPALTEAPAPTATPWVVPLPVSNRPGEPRIAPDALHPSVGLDADGLPLNAEGTLVVYARELRGPPNAELVVFDLGQQERISSFELEANLSFSLQLAGNRVIASFGKQIWSYALDGSDARLLNDELSISYLRPSPDGSFLAISGRGPDPNAFVGFIEVATGDRIALVDLLDEAPEWQGEPHPARWLSPTEVLVGGLCNCDGSPEGYFNVTVSLDGTVERVIDAVPPAQPVAIEIADRFDVSCVLGGFAGGRTFRMVDTGSGATLAEVTATAPVFRGGEVSPDGTEALVLSVDATEELKAQLNSALDSGRCLERGGTPLLDDAPLALSLLVVGSDDLEPVDSRLEVLERWHAGLLPVFVCGGEERAGADTSEWLNGPVPWRSPAGFGEPWGFAADRCQDSRGILLDMRIAGVEVDSGAEAYRVLGFLDPTDSSED